MRFPLKSLGVVVAIIVGASAYSQSDLPLLGVGSNGFTPISCSNTISLVQQAQSFSNVGATSASATFGSTPTNGNTIVALIGGDRAGAPTVTSVTLTNSSGWAQRGRVGANNHDSETWSGVAGATSGTVVNVTFNGSSTNRNLMLSEWSGVLTSAPQDGVGVGNSANSGTSATTGSYSAGACGDLILVSALVPSVISISTDPGAPYTTLTPSNTSFHGSYNLPTMNGSQATATWTISSSAAWNALIVGLKHS